MADRYIRGIISSDEYTEVYRELTENSIDELTISPGSSGDPGIKHLGRFPFLHNERKLEMIIAEALKINTSLLSLNLGYNLLGTYAKGHRILKSLKTNQTLIELDLSGNYLGGVGSRHIAAWLKQNRSLKKLNLSDNNIKLTGAAKLARGLKDNSTLQSIDLSKNDLGNEGSAFLAEVLRGNSTLNSLSLDRNKIDDSGAADLAEALMRNCSLHTLDIRENEIGDIGAERLSAMLMTNKTLKVLFLGDRISDAGAQFLAQALKVNQSLLSLQLSSYCPIGEPGCTSFQEALRFNDTIIDLCFYIPFNFNFPKLVENQRKMGKKYLDIMHSNKSIPWNRSRITFVGEGKAGKTATIRSLLRKPFNPNWDSTIGTEVTETEPVVSGQNLRLRSHNYSHHNLDPRMFAARIAIQDSMRTTGSSKGSKSHKNKIEKKKSTEEQALNMNVDVKGPNSTESEEIDEILKGSFLFDRNGTIAYEENMLIKATTESEDKMSLSLWDFGGQDVFYAMHHIFLTQSGIYTLVFDMREIIDPILRTKSTRYISFWLKSLKIHAPFVPILLVGTFLDEIDTPDDLKLVNDIISEITKSSTSEIVSNIDVDLLFYPIDNKTRRGVAELLSKIKNVIENDSFVKEPVPIKWIWLLKKILEKRWGEPESVNFKPIKSFLFLDDVKQMASELNLNSNAELKKALSLFHQRGMIVYLSTTAVLQEIIIIDPQWVIDNITKVIRDGNHLHLHDLDPFLKVGLLEDYEIMVTKGFASRDLLEYFWNKEHVDFFVDLMKHTLLLSEWNSSDKELYLVPSLLKGDFVGVQKGIRCIFDFADSFLALGLFQRLVCMCVSHSTNGRIKKSEEPKVFRNFCSLEFEPNLTFALISEEQQISLIVQDINSAAKAFKILVSMLQKIGQDTMNSRLIWNVSFEDIATGDFLGVDQARKQSLFPWFEAKQNESGGDKNVQLDVDSFLLNL